LAASYGLLTAVIDGECDTWSKHRADPVLDRRVVDGAVAVRKTIESSSPTTPRASRIDQLERFRNSVAREPKVAS